jgi:hypothetical protein
MILDIFEILSKHRSIYVNIDSFFIKKIKSLIIENYKSLTRFNYQELKINYGTLKHEFQKAKYHSFLRLLKITKILKINKEEIFENIRGFRVLGSHRENDLFLPRRISVNENFVEGYALYLAEGDSGSCGQTIPRKVRFTNANLEVIKFFIQWLKTYFLKNDDFYLNIILPFGITIPRKFINQITKKLNLNINQIKVRNDFYNKKIKYRICYDRAILINLILNLENIIKKNVSK